VQVAQDCSCRPCRSRLLHLIGKSDTRRDTLLDLPPRSGARPSSACSLELTRIPFDRRARKASRERERVEGRIIRGDDYQSGTTTGGVCRPLADASPARN
jgi:hypothetical protein